MPKIQIPFNVPLPSFDRFSQEFHSKRIKLLGGQKFETTLQSFLRRCRLVDQITKD